jgi:selenocysteine-specific elongation factor
VILRAGSTVAGAVVLEPLRPRRREQGPEPGPPPAEAPVKTEAVERDLAAAGDATFRVSDTRAAAELERAGRLVRLGDGLALERGAYDRARELAVAECEESGTITLARFRDLLGSSRKTAQLVLERLDGEGVTIRVGDVRRLRRRQPG